MLSSNDNIEKRDHIIHFITVIFKGSCYSKEQAEIHIRNSLKDEEFSFGHTHALRQT